MKLTLFFGILISVVMADSTFPPVRILVSIGPETVADNIATYFGQFVPLSSDIRQKLVAYLQTLPLTTLQSLLNIVQSIAAIFNPGSSGGGNGCVPCPSGQNCPDVCIPVSQTS